MSVESVTLTRSIDLNGSHEIGVPEIPVILAELHLFEVFLRRHHHSCRVFLLLLLLLQRTGLTTTLDPIISVTRIGAKSIFLVLFQNQIRVELEQGK